MPLIELRCICGKSYQVPADKAGRRLQCRRCGNVQRIPGGPAPREESGLRLLDEPADPSVRPAAPPEPRPQTGRREGRTMRRCPACGMQDESGVVVCVRCGYDWRTGKRLREADQAADEPHDPAAEAAQAEADQLASLSWLSLSPLGIVVGPYVAWRSQALEARLRRLMRLETGAAVRQVRLTAISGAVLWLVVLALLGVLVASRSSRSAAGISELCRQRLEQVGRLLRERIRQDGEFPPPTRQLSAALHELVDGAGEGLLICPAQDGLHPYRIASHELLTGAAKPNILIAWDQEPHADGLGKVNFRALRLDGTIEVFANAGELARARERPAYPDLGAPGPRPTVAPEDGPEPTANGPAPEALKRHLTRLLAFAYECDDEDPELSGALKVTREAFVQRLELVPEQLLPMALADPDPKVRVPAVRLAARLDLPATEVAELVEPLAGDPLVEVRLVVGLLRQTRGDARWLPLLCDVAEAGDPLVRQLALAKLGEGAQRLETMRRILEQAGEVRRRLGARGDEAIFPLPPETLPNAVSLLDDGGVGREALAVLYSGGEASLEPLRAALGKGTSQRQTGVLRALDLLRRAELIDLPAFLEDLERVTDVSARTEGLKVLLEGEGTPPAPLQAWALERLRGGSLPNQLRQLLAQLLERLPGTALVDGLFQPGDHGTILHALKSRRREGEVAIDGYLEERWDRIPTAGTRQALTEWLAGRWHPDSVRGLVRALADGDEGVRVAAGRALLATRALRPQAVRSAVARIVSERLDAEDSTQVRISLYTLASTPIYCSTAEDEHDCDKHLIKELRNLARKGDVRAIRALGTHVNSKTASILLRMLDAATDNGAKGEISGALRGVTGSGEVVYDADYWKQMLSNQRDAIEAHQAQTWQNAWGLFEKTQEHAQRQLEQLGATE